MIGEWEAFFWFCVGIAIFTIWAEYENIKSQNEENEKEDSQ